MDEVFGNSSTDTVMEAELSQVLHTIHQDIASLKRRHPHISSTSTSNISLNTANNTHHKQDKSLECKSTNHMQQPTAAPRHSRTNIEPVVKKYQPLPYPRVTSETASAGVLRHTRSAVGGWVSQTQGSLRPRAFSANASSHQHSYVNVSMCHPTSSSRCVPGTYKSVTVTPLPHTTTLPKYMNVPPPLVPISSSAPSTPTKGSQKQRMHHSYIELWSGIKEERDSLSDSECEEIKRSFQEPQTPNSCSSPGYVQMTSPFLKSPHLSNSFNGSVLADFATKLASYAGQLPRNIFCPFCPRYFNYEKSLSSHIHKTHKTELNSMVTNSCSDLKLQQCPLCQAQFYNTSVLPKHLVDFHRASVIEILQQNDCIRSDVMGIHCPFSFCNKMVPHNKTGEEVLLYHIQQLHFSDYCSMIKKIFQPYTAPSFEALRSHSLEALDAGTFKPEVTSTPGLSEKLGTMALAVQSNSDSTWSSHTGGVKSPLPPPGNPVHSEPLHSETQQVTTDRDQELAASPNKVPPSPSKGILRHHNVLSRKTSVRRELRFSVPPVTSEEVFFPESPEPSVSDPPVTKPDPEPQHQQHQTCPDEINRVIPIRVDSLSTADFMDLTGKGEPQQKRRKLGLSLRSRRTFKKKDKENLGERGLSTLVNEATKTVDCGKIQDSAVYPVIRTQGARTFRRPKPVPVPSVPEMPLPAPKASVSGSLALHGKVSGKEESYVSPFTNVKLYSPLRMFRCNSCHVKFCDNESLGSHIGQQHKGLLHLLRPHYGCGVCSAKFFENKYLVKHCLQHHTSLLEIRSPHHHKITIYRFTHD